MAIDVLRSDVLLDPICKALNLEPRKVRRIVLDLEARNEILVYMEMYGGSELLNIKWDTGFENATGGVHEEDEDE
jgi:hypothetical protein